LYRIMQESLQNINKYANANTIKIDLKKERWFSPSDQW
jgi:signal transduction histidine kinase